MSVWQFELDETHARGTERSGVSRNVSAWFKSAQTHSISADVT
ncbi:hypothetical protein [Haladaptatus cibarius]|nr:hypothetical protein [Haladaptatus cibarius]